MNAGWACPHVYRLWSPDRARAREHKARWSTRPAAGMPGWRNGRRDGLKNRCPQGRAGSTPAPGTGTEPQESGREFPGLEATTAARGRRRGGQAAPRGVASQPARARVVGGRSGPAEEPHRHALKAAGSGTSSSSGREFPVSRNPAPPSFIVCRISCNCKKYCLWASRDGVTSACAEWCVSLTYRRWRGECEARESHARRVGISRGAGTAAFGRCFPARVRSPSEASG